MTTMNTKHYIFKSLMIEFEAKEKKKKKKNEEEEKKSRVMSYFSHKLGNIPLST